MTRRVWWLLVAVVVLGAVAYMATRSDDGIAVDSGRVTRSARLRSTVTASGEVVATRYADIGSSAMGKIVALPVREGDRVKAGQVLARIDAVQAESEVTGASALVAALEADERVAGNQVHSAEAEVRSAESAAREAAQTLARRRDLRERGLLAQADFDS